MSISLCIHGHFYQPPREDPWLGRILGEASASPMRHWNERILRESYAPLAFARRVGSGGRIADILNCYEWMSFNAGPTLLQWMRRTAPGVLARMREGDAVSRARWGFGNALAQVYHHVIMPLATPEDRALEVRWAVEDFRFHFGRAPEGMWLSECAVDIPSLESLAAEGIRFVILAPRQARAVLEVKTPGGSGTRSAAEATPVPVDEGSLNIGEPYQVRLPSGASMTAVFYHGGLSQSIAFEGLLRDGEAFWKRISEAAARLAAGRSGNTLLTLATDGETYGHHFTFGEMALAHVLAQGYSRRDGLELTNLAAYIDKNPPTRQVILHEPSSWSCVHGVERWRSDCGCTDGGHPDWNQRWRGPLREALNAMREALAAHFAEAGKDCFTDAGAALLDYGVVLADPAAGDAFAQKWFRAGARDKAWKLLAMREQALAAFASCAWFFDDISRIEPENALTFALRAMELCTDTGGRDVTGEVLRALEKAVSNRPEMGSGKDVFAREVLPRRDTPAVLCLLAALLLDSEGRLPGPGGSALYRFPRLSVELCPEAPAESGSPRLWRGTAIIRTSLEESGTRYAWEWAAPSRAEDDENGFVPLAASTMTARWPEGESGTAGNTSSLENETRAVVGELSRPMRDFLLTQILENREAVERGRMCATAVHVLSLTDLWVEGQREMPRSELWNGFLAFLPFACMRDEHLAPERREQVAALLSRHLAPREKILAGKAVERVLLQHLAEPGADDALLASWAERVRPMLPDMDWWAVQNAVWERWPQKLPLLAAVLGFRRVSSAVSP